LFTVALPLSIHNKNEHSLSVYKDKSLKVQLSTLNSGPLKIGLNELKSNPPPYVAPPETPFNSRFLFLYVIYKFYNIDYREKKNIHIYISILIYSNIY